jgi:aspartyl/asparaginyl beta-hydroxylase (cupin superfamily)
MALATLKWAARNPTAASVAAVNKLFFRAVKGQQRPAFHDIDKVKPELRLLDRNWQVIREEMESVLVHKERVPRYHEIAPRETYISGTVDPDRDWRVFMLLSPIGVPRKNQAKCPRTTELLRQVPGVLQAFFSILDPGKSIPAHCGPWLGYLRYHIGLRVPTNNPPSMRVRDQIHTWEEGRSIVFDDSWEHEVYNKCDGIRVVLIVDFLRPLSPPLHVLNWLILNTLARHTEEGRQARDQIEKYSWHL